ncbi:LacI family DNA-binding transcriptional regulator [Flexivirga meconopsidis]|uniref:LacI family DNA-binding transcriptional regulator n=1 Tax=Flexivirga meconopsidis TaxID=2977121 RepID=UPI0022409C03|nr:LacI family DNA-binding transcriptional regulator [Flexivirga meconopsidis]
MARPTIADIAREAGVSKGAVSFALNGRPGVSDETRKRILEIVERRQWRPHSAARALGRSSTGLVGLVSARPARTLGVEPFFAQLISGLQAGLSAHGVGLQLMVVEDTEAELEVYRSWAAENRVDGVVLLDLLTPDPRIAELDRIGLPAVALGDPARGQRISTVVADDRAATRTIAEYLAALGHTRIHHIAGLPSLRHTRRRIGALKSAADTLGLQVATTTTDFSDTEGAAATRAALTARPTPSALIFDSDLMAVAGLGVAMEMGRSVPRDLSIVSFDDSVLARLMHPSLTALSRDTFALGEQVADCLMQTVAAPTTPVRMQASVPQLVVRESTTPPQS